MNRGIYIIANNFFINQNCVFVVVTFPCHKADQSVFTERNLTVGSSGTVRDYLTDCNLLSFFHDRTLIDTGALVGTFEFNQLIEMVYPGRIFYYDFIRRNLFHNTVMFRNNCNP